MPTFPLKNLLIMALFFVVLFLGRWLLMKRAKAAGTLPPVEDRLMVGDAALDTLIGVGWFIMLLSSRIKFPSDVPQYQINNYYGIAIGVFFFVDWMVRRLVRRMAHSDDLKQSST